MPRVSVIVPLYQKAPTIARTIDSVLAQRCEAFELIVVDDGSTDEGPAIAAAFADPRIRLLRQANAGPGAARNRGIRAALGEYVAFLDADDTWRPDYLMRMTALLDAEPEANAAACAFATARGSLAPLWRRRGISEGIVRVDAATAPEFVVALVAMLSPCATVMRREAALRLGGFYDRDGCRYGEDAYLALRLALDGPVVVSLETLVDVDTGASALNARRRTRPLEPLFVAARELRVATPPALRPLLHDVLAIRAGKAACVMTYWGRHGEARRLVDDFTELRDVRRPWVLLGRLCASPLGAVASRVLVQNHASS